MEKKRVIPVWASVILIVLCAASMVYDIVGIMNSGNGIAATVNYLTYFCATGYAMIYCASGYGKKAASFFLGVVMLFIVAAVFSVVTSAITVKMTGSILPLALFAIIAVCLVLLAAVKNLGKTYSLTLGLIVLVCSLFYLFYALLQFSFRTLQVPFANAVLAVIFFLMIVAKYRDKTARGTT